jgi:hypothetical protein
VLVAFSWKLSRVGYCQGLNKIAAFGLLYLREEDVFWLVVYFRNYVYCDFSGVFFAAVAMISFSCVLA